MLKKNLLLIVVFALSGYVFGQKPVITLSKDQLLGQRNVITSAVPFLTITPDSRSAGMGDAGVARDPDANSIHWNIASMAFIPKKAGISLNAAPWLRQLVPDVWFYHMSGYTKVGRRNQSAVTSSIRYFSLGEIQFTDEFGNTNGNATPYEIAIDLGYATQLSDHFSLGGNMRFINSCLTCGSTGTIGSNSGQAAAGDIGVYYKKPIKINKKDVRWAMGATITNIGNKLSYSSTADRDFIPANLRFGTSFGFKLDDHNEVNFNFDINKLLVPTFPVYFTNAKGGDSIFDGKRVIQYGKDHKDVPVINGIFQSFSDAPGGFREELKEYNISTGLEYWYDKQFAVRLGYFNEADTKGGRKYATFGIGLRYEVFGIDAAYLQPFTQRHPLQNTIRFSLLFDIDAFKKQQEKK